MRRVWMGEELSAGKESKPPTGRTGVGGVRDLQGPRDATARGTDPRWDWTSRRMIGIEDNKRRGAGGGGDMYMDGG